MCKDVAGMCTDMGEMGKCIGKDMGEMCKDTGDKMISSNCVKANYLDKCECGNDLLINCSTGKFFMNRFLKWNITLLSIHLLTHMFLYMMSSSKIFLADRTFIGFLSSMYQGISMPTVRSLSHL